MKAKWLQRHILTGPFVMLALNEQDYLRNTKRMGVKDPPQFSRPDGAVMHSFLTARTLDAACIVCMEPHLDMPIVQVYGLLVHEAVHVWQLWCSQVGERSPGDETEAYAIQQISQRLMDDYDRQTKGLR